MRMKYLTYVNHLSALLTIAMICFQAAGIAATAIENHNATNSANTLQIGDLSRAQLDSMNLDELMNVRHEVNQEIIQKESLNSNIENDPEIAQRGPSMPI